MDQTGLCLIRFQDGVTWLALITDYQALASQTFEDCLIRCIIVSRIFLISSSIEPDILYLTNTDPEFSKCKKILVISQANTIHCHSSTLHTLPNSHSSTFRVFLKSFLIFPKDISKTNVANAASVSVPSLAVRSVSNH